MKKSRKIISLMIALSMSVPMMGTAIPLDAGICEPQKSKTVEVSMETNEDFVFYIDNDEKTAFLAYYQGHDNNIVVPEEYKGNKVTSIMGNAFYNCVYAKSIEIPNSVDYMGSGVFASCTNLTTVKLSNAITELPEKTFENCESLKEIQIPYGVEIIGESAFYKCVNLPAVEIPNSVKTIEQYAFDGCESLKSMEIPSSVTEIGVCVFRDCNDFESINVDPKNEYYTSIDGVLYNKDVTELVACPRDKSYVNIPESVTSIGWAAFIGCKNLTSVEFPDSVNKIGEHAFDGCLNLLSIEIPQGVIEIEPFAFFACSGLGSITIPNSVKEIRLYGISYCTSLKDIYYYGTEEQWKQIEKDEFSESNIEDAVIHYLSGDKSTPDTPDAKKGDINNDGKVTAKDSMIIQRYAVNLAKLDEKQLELADVNKDGKVTNKDALAILRFTIGYKVEGLS